MLKIRQPPARLIASSSSAYHWYLPCSILPSHGQWKIAIIDMEFKTGTKAQVRIV
jgi:hypothetical protein